MVGEAGSWVARGSGVAPAPFGKRGSRQAPWQAPDAAGEDPCVISQARPGDRRAGYWPRCERSYGLQRPLGGEDRAAVHEAGRVETHGPGVRGLEVHGLVGEGRALQLGGCEGHLKDSRMPHHGGTHLCDNFHWQDCVLTLDLAERPEAASATAVGVRFRGSCTGTPAPPSHFPRASEREGGVCREGRSLSCRGARGLSCRAETCLCVPLRRREVALVRHYGCPRVGDLKLRGVVAVPPLLKLLRSAFVYIRLKQSGDVPENVALGEAEQARTHCSEALYCHRD